jgi:hypothetical protein
VRVPTASRIYVDQKRKVLYCAIPKAASSSWKVTLATLTGKFIASDHRQLLKVHDDAFMASIGLNQLSSFSHFSVASIIKTYRKFLVVRHPFERLVSAFVDKFEKTNKWTEYFHHKFGREIMRRYRGKATQHELETGRNVTFPEFVNLITDIDVDRAMRINEHWETYQGLCMPCSVPYDVIIEYDTMEEDNRRVLQGIFRVANPGSFFPHRNPNPGSAEARTNEYMKMLDDNQLQKLLNFYLMDFKMFNYTWPR